jgi:lysyl-tRNA synthetase class 2
MEPFAYNFQQTHSSVKLHELYKDLPNGQEDKNEVVSIAGRIMFRRFFGKLAFFTLQDDKGSIQIYIEKSRLKDGHFELLRDYSDTGDIVGVAGTMKRTDKGELSVAISDWTMLTKSMAPLPDKFHGMTDVNKRYRQRYIDFISNPAAREVMLMRTKIISYVRNFFNARDFLEMDTPILTSQSGGAEAKPFLTHHNSLDMALTLRIATELHLKRLVVGGFHKVYEIGRVFRNEGLSTRHNPEFTSIELYQSYADYEGMMALTEELLSSMAADLLGKTREIDYQGELVHFTRPFRRVSMNEIVREKTGLDFYPLIRRVAELPEASEEQRAELLREAKELAKRGTKIPWEAVDEQESVGEVLNLVFEEVCEKTIVQPTFVTEHPTDISPLAKKHRGKPGLTERFELFIIGREYANAFSELTDPVDQRKRFQIQVSPYQP